MLGADRQEHLLHRELIFFSRRPIGGTQLPATGNRRQQGRDASEDKGSKENRLPTKNKSSEARGRRRPCCLKVAERERGRRFPRARIGQIIKREKRQLS